MAFISKVNPIEVLQVGTELFQMMTEHISTDEEVEAAENFTSPRRRNSSDGVHHITVLASRANMVLPSSQESSS